MLSTFCPDQSLFMSMFNYPENHPLFFVFIVLHIAGIVLAFPALLYTRTPQGSIAWVISLVFFPYVAVPLYLILGPRRFEGYIEMRRINQEANDELNNISSSITRDLHNYLQPDQGNRSGFFKSLSHLSDLHICRGNSCKLLIDADQAYPDIYDAIRNARDYILVEFYIIKSDLVGDILRKLLIERALEGVRVYVIYDEIGSHKLPPGYITDMRKAGIHIQPFNGKRFFLRNIVRVNFRDHRKIVVVDGRIGFVGGMNIGLEYIGQGNLGYWRDTFLEIAGPAVVQAQLTFLEDWHWATNGDIPELFWEIHPQEKDMSVLILPSGPADQVPTWRTTVIALANEARERLWIATPYFVPDEATFASLQAAALRGVDVRILKPEKADHPMVKLSSMTYLPETVPFGIRIYHYTKGFMHQKIILVDDDLATVGTANLDNRSLTLNFEITALIHDIPFARQVHNMLEEDFNTSRQIQPEEYASKPLIYKIICNFFRLLAPIQ